MWGTSLEQWLCCRDGMQLLGECSTLWKSQEKCLGKNVFQVIQEGELGFLLLVYRVTEGGIGGGIKLHKTVEKIYTLTRNG